MYTCKAITTSIRKRFHHEPFNNIKKFEAGIIHPEEIGVRDAAFFLSGQLDKIQGTQPETTLDYELERIRRGNVVHAPTILYELPHAELIDGHVYSQGERIPLVNTYPPFISKRPKQKYSKRFMSASVNGNQYFGDWLLHDCMSGLLEPAIATGVCMDRHDWPHVPAYRKLFSRAMPTVLSGVFESLYLVSDYSQNSNMRDRYGAIRKRIASDYKPNGKNIYVSRGAMGASRKLTNEKQIIKELGKRGFKILDVTRHCVEHIIRDLSGANVVIGIEGSHLTHALLAMSAQGSLITIQQPERFIAVLKDTADCIGIKYGFVVADRESGGYSVNIDELLKTIDLTS